MAAPRPPKNQPKHPPTPHPSPFPPSQVGAKELEKVLNRSEDEGSGEEERGRPLLP